MGEEAKKTREEKVRAQLAEASGAVTKQSARDEWLYYMAKRQRRNSGGYEWKWKRRRVEDGEGTASAPVSTGVSPRMRTLPGAHSGRNSLTARPYADPLISRLGNDLAT